jgi:Tol biopolymer transport system component
MEPTGGPRVIGKTFGHFEIIALLGKGGMGEVYRALDTKLGREVAVKVLPEAFALDPDRMARFDREARVLASLNHPGIATIFGIDQHDGLRFLVMELAEGEDLAQRLARGPLPIPEALDVARQIAEALQEAHARGIAHRDLKPANVKRSDRGKVKILDFGLAKALVGEQANAAPVEDSPTTTRDVTRTGTILGTAAYMSPEQARGDPIDTRTDVWSFGCVLWECLTGVRVFGGRTESDSISAVLRAEPDWSLLPPGTPPGVRHVLRRCLAKDPDRRLHHIADARIELDDAVAGDAAPATVAPAAGRSLRRYRIAVFVLGGLLASLLAVSLAGRFGWIGSPGDTARELRNPLDGARFTRLTDFPGDEFEGALSPDGRFVAFVSDRDGPFDVLVGQVDSREYRNVTAGRKRFDLADVRAPVRSVGFTGDGSEIWFGGGTGQRLQTMSLLGGPVRNFLGDDVVNVAWSPDGGRIVYHRSTPGDPVFVADRDGSNEILILPSEVGHHQHYATWSPDGEWIYVVRGRPITKEMDLWRLRPDGTGAEQLTWGKRDVKYPTPIDARTVLYCAQVLDVERGLSRRATVGVEQYSSLSGSADGRRLVATAENPRATLWRVPILDRMATEEDVAPYSLPTARALAPRFGGEDLFYLSSRGAGDGLWRAGNGESVEIWSGSSDPLLITPAASRDGRTVALVLRRESGERLHVLSADGAELRALTDEVDVRGTVSWSPDGEWIAAGGSRGGELGLFRIPVAGGPPVRILDGEALSPVWSPAGDLIVYAGPQVQALSPLLGVRPDGTPVELPDIHVLREGGGERFRFLPDGSALVYTQGLSPAQDFMLLDLATGQSRRLTRLDDPATMLTFDIAPDGSEIVFDRLQQGSDLVLIDLAGTFSALRSRTSSDGAWVELGSMAGSPAIHTGKPSSSPAGPLSAVSLGSRSSRGSSSRFAELLDTAGAVTGNLPVSREPRLR